MAAHTKEQRRFIIGLLGAFCPPNILMSAFCAKFKDTACNDLDIAKCNPRNVLLDPEEFAHFQSMRILALDDLEKSAPYAKQKARLIALNWMAEGYIANRQPAEARAVFRDIREEVAITGPASTDGVPEVTRITRTIVDPVPVAPPSE